MAANTCCRSAASASTLMLAPWLAGRARTRLGAIPDLEPLTSLWSPHGSIMVGLWLHYARAVTRLGLLYSSTVAAVWLDYVRNMAPLWPSHGSMMVALWLD